MKNSTLHNTVSTVKWEKKKCIEIADIYFLMELFTVLNIDWIINLLYINIYINLY